MPIKEIAIAALIATNGVTDPESPQRKILMGGQASLVATERCIKDGRDMAAGFTLTSDYQTGYLKVRCQLLETTSGDYYAAKGYYYKDAGGINAFIDALKQ
jgi:hypothetical protein